ncbi:hypothetical protein D3C81_2002960 [compost metagenome]
MYSFGIQTAIQPLVAVILKYGKVKCSENAGLVCCISKLGVMFSQLVPQHDSALVFSGLLEYLLLTGLDGKICLAEGDDLLSRIGVLNDEVAGIPCKSY